MSIKITQPFSFDSKRPNFERDVIDSSTRFVSQDPLVLTDMEKMSLAADYDVGHIVWDTYTSKHYGVAPSPTGINECILVKLDFTDTTLSGVAYCSSGAATTVKVGTMPGFALANGQRILMYLATSSTVADAKLDVNSTGEKYVHIGGSNTTATNFVSGYWLCQYDGTYWNCTRFTLPIATSTVEGVVKLGSDDVQTNTAELPTTTINRTYPVQLNASDQMVVNVPWRDVPREEHKLIYYTPDDPDAEPYDGLSARQFMYEEAVVVDNATDLALCMSEWEQVDFTMNSVSQNYVTELISCNPYEDPQSYTTNDIITNDKMAAGAVNSNTNIFWGYNSTNDYINAKFNDDWGGRTAILYDPNNTDEYFVHDALYGFHTSDGGNDGIGLAFITFNNTVLTDGNTMTYDGVSVDESSYSKFTNLSIDLGCRQGRSFTFELSQYKRKPDSVVNGTPTSDYQTGYKSNAYWRNGRENRGDTNHTQPYQAYVPISNDGFGIVGSGNGTLPGSATMLPTNNINGKGGTAGYIRCTTQRIKNIYKFGFSLPNTFTYVSNYKQLFLNGQYPQFNIVCEIVLNLDNYTIKYKKYNDTDYTTVSIPQAKRHLFDELKTNNVYYGFWQSSTPCGAIYNISYIHGSNLSNMILDIENDDVWQLGADGNWNTVPNTVPLDIMTGSHMNWNGITNKLWYSNGQEIYQIFGEFSTDTITALQSNWNETDPSSPAFILNKPNINSMIGSKMYEEIEYADLVAKLSSGGFTKGKKYRITDYVTTSTQQNTKSMGYPFDLVVTAISRMELDRHASALPHQGSSQFSLADLKRWRIWYDINNDTNKYAWADVNNGKGVIYRMIDEWGNDCPYDFKNIQFKRKLTNGNLDETNGTDEWVFTFSAWDTDYQSFVSEDLSLITKAVVIDDCYNTCQYNVIKPAFLDNRPQYLNNIVFLNKYNEHNYEYVMCYSNSFGENCLNNTFGNGCYHNEFGDACGNNKLGEVCHDNKFYNWCSNNVLGNSCFRNEFGFNSNYNNLGEVCGSNTFGSSCTYNTFGNNCTYNELGSGCDRIKLGNVCWNNRFGESCKHIEFEESGSDGGYFCSYNIIESGNQHLRIYNVNGQQPSNSNVLKNIYVAQNCFKSTSTYDEITTITRGRAYRTTVGRDSNGTLRIYNEDDPVQAQVQADWNETDSTDPSFIQHKPTVSSVTFRYW